MPKQTKATTWRAIVASSLDWEQAHVSFAKAVQYLPAALRTRRPQGFEHSVWDLVEHIRLAQHDLLDFLRNPRYTERLTWPDDYWPKRNAKPGTREWNASVAQVARDTRAVARFATAFRGDLTARIPRGTGQTYLRTVLVTVAHNAYHTGQIVDVRKAMGAWPPE
ncbi:MAG TPA: DinB family protein [Gemmatimonadaceae bacterium]|nr:DinB family protein [Gemmatimonadaceae bacterium]